MDPSGEKFEISAAEQDRDFLDKVSKAADVSYKEVAKNLDMDPDLVYHSRRCEQVSDVLKDELDKEGIDSNIAKYVGWDITSHEMIFPNLNGKEIVIDPTWQQFLEKPDRSKPKVLISTKEKIEERLTELGVPSDKHHIWKEARVRDIENKSE